VESLDAVPLSSLLVGAAGRTARVPLPESVAVSRESFDIALIRAACEAGATFLPETSAFVGSAVNASRTVRLRQADGVLETRARIVLAADGLAGRLLRSSGFDSPAEEGSRVGAGVVVENAPEAYAPGVIHMACADGGYVGLVRVEHDRLNVAAAFEVEFIKARGGLGPAAAAVLRAAGFPPLPGCETLHWRGTPALTRQATHVGADRAFVLGDAAGYVEPFTGEGMAWALTSAVALAPIVDRALDRYDASCERAWTRTYNRIVRRRQYVCRLLAAGLRRPALLSWAVAVVSAMPGVANPFVRHINLPFDQQGLPSR
jgi:flavin-dependent dehydrogenase